MFLGFLFFVTEEKDETVLWAQHCKSKRSNLLSSVRDRSGEEKGCDLRSYFLAVRFVCSGGRFFSRYKRSRTLLANEKRHWCSSSCFSRYVRTIPLLHRMPRTTTGTATCSTSLSDVRTTSTRQLTSTIDASSSDACDVVMDIPLNARSPYFSPFVVRPLVFAFELWEVMRQ